AAWWSSGRRCSIRCANGSPGTSRVRATANRSRSSPPRSGRKPASWAARCSRGPSTRRLRARRVAEVAESVAGRLGVTLPSFRDAPAPALAVATTAEAAGLDGVFAYDHLFRTAPDGTLRPALELLALMGAVAAETHRIAIGSLVARATLRPPAVLAQGLDTGARSAGRERVLATIGSGDEESRDEMERFGLHYGTVSDRVQALRNTVETVRDRGYPVWVGGHDPAVRECAAAHADGWNRWGGSAAKFR